MLPSVLLLPALFLKLMPFTLATAGYIGAGNAEGRGHLPLCQRQGAAQTIPQADDLSLPGREAGFDQRAEPQSAVPVVQVLQHRVIHSHHVQQLQSVAVPVAVDGV